LYHAEKFGPICGRHDPSALVRRDPDADCYLSRLSIVVLLHEELQRVRNIGIGASHIGQLVVTVGTQPVDKWIETTVFAMSVFK
jgi:hypothetical protein